MLCIAQRTLHIFDRFDDRINFFDVSPKKICAGTIVNVLFWIGVHHPRALKLFVLTSDGIVGWVTCTEKDALSAL